MARTGLDSKVSACGHFLICININHLAFYVRATLTFCLPAKSRTAPVGTVQTAHARQPIAARFDPFAILPGHGPAKSLGQGRAGPALCPRRREILVVSQFEIYHTQLDGVGWRPAWLVVKGRKAGIHLIPMTT